MFSRAGWIDQGYAAGGVTRIARLRVPTLERFWALDRNVASFRTLEIYLWNDEPSPGGAIQF